MSDLNISTKPYSCGGWGYLLWFLSQPLLFHKTLWAHDLLSISCFYPAEYWNMIGFQALIASIFPLLCHGHAHMLSLAMFVAVSFHLWRAPAAILLKNNESASYWPNGEQKDRLISVSWKIMEKDFTEEEFDRTLWDTGKVTNDTELQLCQWVINFNSIIFLSCFQHNPS